MTQKELKKILESNKDVMLYFYNNSCGICESLSPIIKTFKNKPNFYTINTFKDKKISELFKVDWVPVLMEVKNGKLKVYNGGMKIEKFLL